MGYWKSVIKWAVVGWIAIAVVIAFEFYRVRATSILYVKNYRSEVLKVRRIYINDNLVRENEQINPGHSLDLTFRESQARVSLHVFVDDSLGSGVSQFACRLDNTHRPCVFEIAFSNETLRCAPCETVND